MEVAEAFSGLEFLGLVGGFIVRGSTAGLSWRGMKDTRAYGARVTAILEVTVVVVVVVAGVGVAVVVTEEVVVVAVELAVAEVAVGMVTEGVIATKRLCILVNSVMNGTR